uniref:lipoprotein 17-related variable surface protein n=1 Tax=Mycoplasmopsis primatum TaxID=55604 RepID=UPI00056D2C80
NNLNYHKNFVLTGFYSTKKFDDLKNNLDIENRDDPSIPYLLPSKYDTNNIKLKNESLLLKSNPNLKIDKKITTNDNDGIMSISIILRDSLNNLEYSKVLEIRNFYSKTAFHQQIAELSEDDLNITVNRKMRPSDYHFDYSKPINLKDNSSLLAKNPNLKIIKYKKVSVISHSNARGTLKIHIWVADEKNNLYNDKDIEITGFAKQEWTVQELDYLVDKIMTTPISQGKYILTTITGIPSFSGAKYRNLYLKQSYYSNFLTFEIDEEHKDIQSPSLNWMIEKTFLMIRVHKKDEPENVKVRWKVKGEEKILTARKQWYQLYGTHGLKKSTKFITIYVIYHSDKSNYFDVDINVQEL